MQNFKFVHNLNFSGNNAPVDLSNSQRGLWLKMRLGTTVVEEYIDFMSVHKIHFSQMKL